MVGRASAVTTQRPLRWPALSKVGEAIADLAHVPPLALATIAPDYAFLRGSTAVSTPAITVKIRTTAPTSTIHCAAILAS